MLTTRVQENEESTEDDGSAYTGMAGPDATGAFIPISKPPIAQSLAPMAVMAGQSSGGPPVTIVLLCACAMLLLARASSQTQALTPRE